MSGARRRRGSPRPASALRLHRVTAIVHGLAGLFLLGGMSGLLGCVSPTGGWDVEALLEAEPELEAIAGQRIGDLLPFPALIEGRLWLVVCRFPTDATVPVIAGGEHWPADWGRPTVAAVDRSLPALRLALRTADDEVESPAIEIVSLPDAVSEGPAGLGDTSTECDVGPVPGDPSAVRGRLRRATIRLRRSRLDSVGRPRPAQADEWAGALAHELGHALGFPSHVAAGGSLLVREEGSLRSIGRRALEGRRLEVPSLTALYRLAPGRILGAVSLAPATTERLEAIAARLAEISTAEGASALGPFARVGERAARLSWRWPSGRMLALDLPRWRDELRAGEGVTVIMRRGTSKGESALGAR